MCIRDSYIPILSIISCRMLEDELTSILANDDNVKQLVIVDSTEQQELARKLRSENRPFLIKDFEGAYNHVKKHQQLSLIHISEPTRLLSISYAVFCLKKKKKKKKLKIKKTKIRK